MLEVTVQFDQRPVRGVRNIGIRERHPPGLHPPNLAGNTPATLQQVFESLEIIEHVDHAAARETEIDAALEIIRAVIGEDLH